MKNSLLSLDHVALDFGETRIFSDLNLAVEKGEFVAIVGPSGCGKTTLLNLFSGSVKPDEGKVSCHGSLRMVYQQSSLFPWLTVEENIALGLGKSRQDKISEVLKIIGLADFSKHFPYQLSGGMRQRVELARALVGETNILLLDEPFSSLDYLTKLNIRSELIRMLKEFPRTTIMVTHDIEEAVQLADRIVVFSERPASILKEVKLISKTPRFLTDSEVISIVRQIFAVLGIFEIEDLSKEVFNDPILTL
jgi:NitT/TauT family transport system ATP-binding protein